MTGHKTSTHPLAKSFSNALSIVRDAGQILAVTNHEDSLTFHLSDGSYYIARDDSFRNIKVIEWTQDKLRCDLEVVIKPIIDYIVLDDMDINIVLK